MTRPTEKQLAEALERIADPRNTHFAGDAQVVAAEALSAYRTAQQAEAGAQSSAAGDGVEKSTAGKALDDPRLQELFSAAIDGALTSGYQGVAPAPAGHWLEPWWKRGRSVAEHEEQRAERGRQQGMEQARAAASSAQEPMTDSEIEATCKKLGARWDGNRWVIEDADLHPLIRSFAAPTRMAGAAPSILPSENFANEQEAAKFYGTASDEGSV